MRVAGSNEQFFVVDTETKGDCLPQSICIALNDSGNGTCLMDMRTVFSAGQAAVRQAIVCQLQQPCCRSMVQRFIDCSDPLETVETYLRKASQPRCYVGQLELEAAALQYRRPIQVYYQLQESWNWPVSVPTLLHRRTASAGVLFPERLHGADVQRRRPRPRQRIEFKYIHIR